MSYPRYTLKLSGGEVAEYQIYSLPPEVPMEDLECPLCHKDVHRDALLVQCGFWEDRHTLFVVCKSCGKRAAYEQHLPFDWEVQK